MNKGSSAFIATESIFSEALSNSGFNHLSLFAAIVISKLVHLATSTVSTVGQDSKALSTISFSTIFLSPLLLPSLVITILQLQSLILLVRAEDEKPANTTE